MEILLAIAIFGLAAAGLGLGLALGRGPAQASCGASAGLPDAVRCDNCPLRRRAAAAEAEQ